MSAPISRWRATYSFEPNRCEVERRNGFRGVRWDPAEGGIPPPAAGVYLEQYVASTAAVPPRPARATRLWCSRLRIATPRTGGRRWFVLKTGRATALRETRAFGAPTDDPLDPSRLDCRFERKPTPARARPRCPRPSPVSARRTVWNRIAATSKTAHPIA